MRFDLRVESYRVATRMDPAPRAVIDLTAKDSDEARDAMWRAEPDDVAAIARKDEDLIRALGGHIWVGQMFDRRRRRRLVYQSFAGRLGAFLCDSLERDEGWPDAPKA